MTSSLLRRLAVFLTLLCGFAQAQELHHLGAVVPLTPTFITPLLVSTKAAPTLTPISPLLVSSKASAPCVNAQGHYFRHGQFYYEDNKTRCQINYCYYGREIVYIDRCPKVKLGKCRRRIFIALACNPGEVVNTCRNNDYLCPGSLKCCRTQRCVTSCEAPAGPNPGECPPLGAVSDGPSNCEIDGDCGYVAKCCRNAQGRLRCTAPKRPNPGQCPALGAVPKGPTNCAIDADCGDVDKCCRNPEGRLRCTAPKGPNPDQCPSLGAVSDGPSNCEADSDCGDVDKCCRNVEGQRRCTKPKAGDSGECPAIGEVSDGPSDCRADSDCKYTEKCCPNVEGQKRCSPKVKPGKCRRRIFIALACNPGEIVNTCHNNDYLCPGSLKCCRTQRCVTSCEEPAGPNPGTCPSLGAVSDGPSNCEIDADCGYVNKCCHNVEGQRRCTRPRSQK